MIDEAVSSTESLGEASSRHKAGKGTLQKAPVALDRQYIRALDVMVVATSTLQEYYSFRSSQIKTPRQGLEHNLFYYKEGWQKELSCIIRNSVFNCDSLMQCHAFDNNEEKCCPKATACGVHFSSIRPKGITSIPGSVRLSRLFHTLFV